MAEETKQAETKPASRRGGTSRRDRERRGEVEREKPVRTPRPMSSGISDKPCGCGK